MRNRLALVAELNDCSNYRGRNDDTDDSGDSKHWLLEIVNYFGVWSFWLPRVLRRIGCTACKEHGGCNTGYCSNYSTTHTRKPIDVGN